jgi:hypothetical protein
MDLAQRLKDLETPHHEWQPNIFLKDIKKRVRVTQVHPITVPFAMSLARAWNMEAELRTFCDKYLGGRPRMSTCCIARYVETHFSSTVMGPACMSRRIFGFGLIMTTLPTRCLVTIASSSLGTKKLLDDTSIPSMVSGMRIAMVVVGDGSGGKDKYWWLETGAMGDPKCSLRHLLLF